MGMAAPSRGDGQRAGEGAAARAPHRRLTALDASSSASGSASSFAGADVVAVGASSASASASSADGDFLVSDYGNESASASSDADLMYRRTQGSCAFYPVNASGCRTPRSCFDCLNYDVAPERAGCMVNERGQCVSVTGNYTAARDYRYATAANANVTTSGSASGGGVDVGATLISGPGAEFVAANVSYCAASDTKCAACRRGVFLEFSPGSITRTSLFCLGDDGCVCVALCEMDDWEARVGGTKCSNSTASGQAGSSASSDGNLLVNSGDGGTTDESTRGGFGGRGSGADTGEGFGTFWSAASGVLALLALTLAVVMYMSKRHRQARAQSRRDLGTPQAPTLSPRRDQGPPESLLASLLRRFEHRHSVRRADSAEASTQRTDAGSTGGDAASDSSRSLRLFGWQAMRQQVIEKETLHPVVASSGIRRVAISGCLPRDSASSGGDADSSACVASPRSLPGLGRFDEGSERLVLFDGDSRRLSMSSLSSSAILSSPSNVIPFMSERDDDDMVGHGHSHGYSHGHSHGHGDGVCFEELVTPPARSPMLK